MHLPMVHVLRHIPADCYSGQEIQLIFHLVDFIYEIIQLLSEIIPRNGFLPSLIVAL